MIDVFLNFYSFFTTYVLQITGLEPISAALDNNKFIAGLTLKKQTLPITLIVFPIGQFRFTNSPEHAFDSSMCHVVLNNFIIGLKC